LNRAATSAQYLRARETNLGLLEAYGKNAWLVGNARLEDELKALEKEVADKSMEKEDVARERREAEMGLAAEMQTLEETWKVGVGRMLEAQAAAEGLRLEILERKREGKVV
jgi:pre-mRNA-splicing factor SPF27